MSAWPKIRESIIRFWHGILDHDRKISKRVRAETACRRKAAKLRWLAAEEVRERIAAERRTVRAAVRAEMEAEKAAREAAAREMARLAEPESLPEIQLPHLHKPKPQRLDGPTQRQVAYLAHLGVQEMPETREDASELIDDLHNRFRAGDST